MNLNYLLAIALFLSSFICLTFSESGSYDLVKEAGKLDKAKEIFDNIKNSDLVETAKSVSKWGLPLLQALGSFAKVILGSLAGESKELIFMKEQFKIINQKMDVVDQEFENIKNALDWNVIKIQYSQYERAIKTLKQHIIEIPEAPQEIRSMLTDEFVIAYDQLYHSASDNLYESLVNVNKIYSENLIKAARKYLKDDRKAVEKFMMGNIQLIMKGLEIEIFYNNIKNIKSFSDYWDNMWKTKLDKLMQIMKQQSGEISENFRNQIEVDTEEFNVNHYQLSNKDYTAQFYHFLTSKFYWRKWFLVTYGDISGYENHCVSQIGGLIRFRMRGHNIVFGSVDRNADFFNRDNAQKALNAVPSFVMDHRKGAAQEVWLNLMTHMKPNNVYPGLVAVIGWGSGVWYIGPDKAYRKWDGTIYPYGRKTLNLIVMG